MVNEELLEAFSAAYELFNFDSEIQRSENAKKQLFLSKI